MAATVRSPRSSSSTLRAMSCSTAAARRDAVASACRSTERLASRTANAITTLISAADQRPTVITPFAVSCDRAHSRLRKARFNARIVWLPVQLSDIRLQITSQPLMAAALLSVCGGRTKACVFRLDKDGYIVNSDVWDIIQTVRPLITSAQTRASRAMIGIDQRQLTALAGLSTPAIQRMEASDGAAPLIR